ncbi:MAG: hypothetical protein ACRBB6_09810 [Neptuniibacter sp.]
MCKHGVLLGIILSPTAFALESDWKGIVDLRYSHTDALTSFVSAGQGKFQHSPGSDLSLGQLGLANQIDFSGQLSLHSVLNAFSDSDKDRLGITELYVKYRTIPDVNGFRSGARIGVFYPAISLENQATAWSTANSLTPSTMNSWIGEEVRATGLEYTAEWLGKFRGKESDIKFNGTLFFKNDTAGALISWHGWTQSSRQTVLGERLPLPYTPALDSTLIHQARSTNPFHEEDGKPGYMASVEWKLHRKGRLQLGYFDSNTTPYTQTNGQYGWDTRFVFAGFQWQLSPHWSLQGQIMQGDTLMQSPDRIDVINNDYRSAYLSLGWKKGDHRINTRIEEFSVTDHDSTPDDDNTEYGKALSASYRYRLQRHWFLLGEYSWINSIRPARLYSGDDAKQLEQQVQMALRYYF